MCPLRHNAPSHQNICRVRVANTKDSGYVLGGAVNPNIPLQGSDLTNLTDLCKMSEIYFPSPSNMAFNNQSKGSQDHQIFSSHKHECHCLDFILRCDYVVSLYARLKLVYGTSHHWYRMYRGLPEIQPETRSKPSSSSVYNSLGLHVYFI